MPTKNNMIRLKSFTGDTWYNISLDRRTCDCPAFRMMPGPPCNHLNALGIYSERKPFIPQSHPTFSQALSALVKSLRIRRVEDAVYWLVYLDSFREKTSRFRVARRLLIGSAEDGHSVAVMEKVVERFSTLTRGDTDLLYLAAEAVRICKIPNWWHPASGGPDYIYSGLVGERELLHFAGDHSQENMTRLIEQGIEERNKSMALAGVMGLSHARLSSTKQAELILALAKKHQHLLAERLAQVHLSARSALSGDNNFLCQAAWMMAGGQSPVADTMESVFAAEVMELLDKAKYRWKRPQPIPGWCCDGVHSAGEDVRFMGMWNHMFAVCRAFAHYGRVDPEDEWIDKFRCDDGLEIESSLQSIAEHDQLQSGGR
jgi:hypothetical protein